MTTMEFLADLYKRNVRLKLNNDKLSYIASKGAMTDELREELVKRKTDIIEFLKIAVHSGQTRELPQDKAAIPLIPKSLLHYVYADPAVWWEILWRIDMPLNLSAGDLEKVVNSLIKQHDGLRIRMTLDTEVPFGCRQHIAAPAKDNSVDVHDLSAVNYDEQEIFISTTVNTEWEKINLAAGPVIRFVFFYRGTGCLNTLLVITHHFVMDMISMDILRNDFLTACRQVIMKNPVDLPQKSSTVREWAETMKAYALSESGGREWNYWKSLPLGRISRLPEDYPAGSISGISPQESVTGNLTEEEARLIAKGIMER